jgi:hypothetical protein
VIAPVAHSNAPIGSLGGIYQRQTDSLRGRRLAFWGRYDQRKSRSCHIEHFYVIDGFVPAIHRSVALAEYIRGKSIPFVVDG